MERSLVKTPGLHAKSMTPTTKIRCEHYESSGQRRVDSCDGAFAESAKIAALYARHERAGTGSGYEALQTAAQMLLPRLRQQEYPGVKNDCDKGRVESERRKMRDRDCLTLLPAWRPKVHGIHSPEPLRHQRRRAHRPGHSTRHLMHDFAVHAWNLGERWTGCQARTAEFPLSGRRKTGNSAPRYLYKAGTPSPHPNRSARPAVMGCHSRDTAYGRSDSAAD
ncbi:hypothetical protein EJ03DRAFT_65372 [Teratosphaeria nubilosa]|uniref:Uncharacterized protein n=1 Tax=Teratosphaeria nubilosa TaxID=161662 RepID=A0A6G1LEI2_9PEZI|nr:hypothetical protein EJ03DRAFT_65372 [Teratosphaeria nubilosa]